MAEGERASMIKGHDIVCLSAPWDRHWCTPQQFMVRLAKHNRVLLVDEAFSPLSFFTGIRTRGEVWRQFKHWRQGYRQVAKNIYADSPPPIMPLRYNKIVNTLNASIIGRWLARRLRQLGFRRPIYWNFHPSFTNLSRYAMPSLSIYHIGDEFASVPHWWNPARCVHACEAACCREADVVICTARSLVETRRHLNPNIHFVAEAADFDLFSTATLPETAVPDDIAGLPGKIIGYVGVTDFRMDVDLIAYMAKRQPDWSFVFVGPVRSDVKDIERLNKLPNVHFLGNRAINELPGYIKPMDVCLIPYMITNHARYIFPLKLYEYMAAGKPIVATDMAEMRPYAGREMAIGRSKPEFHEAVVQSMANDSPERVAARLGIASENSWDHRVQEVTEIIRPLLRERQTAEVVSHRGSDGGV
jgi:glycosyltransferase involved in cell wall biosynthesis